MTCQDCQIPLLAGDVCGACARKRRRRERQHASDQRRWREHKAEQLERNRQWRAANPEKVRELRRRHNSPEKARLRTFGISGEEFAAMLAAQGGSCFICFATKPGGTGGWHLDHDHRFNRKDRRGHRGILCSSCNRALGYFRDDINIVRAAADYLASHSIKLTRTSQRRACVA